MHNDILEIILESHKKKLFSGLPMEREEVAEMLLVEMKMGSNRLDEVADVTKEAVELAQKLSESLKDRQMTRRIYDLFIDNHGLSWEFENFYSRILNRLCKEENAKRERQLKTGQ